MLEGYEIHLSLLLAGFVLGILSAMLVRSRKIAALQQRCIDLGKSVNSLKAENSVVDKKLTAANDELAEANEALVAKELRVEELETAFEARSDQLDQTRTDLKEAVQRTNELRKDLAERAEDTLRAEVHARDVENELNMLTGSGEALDSQLLEELSEDDT